MVKIETLGAREHGLRHFLRVRRGQNKKHMLRRFLQCFQERVEGFCRQHVHFVDDVDFAFAHAWRKAHLLTDASDLVDAAVGGGVDLDHVEKTVFVDGTTVFAGVAGFAVLRIETVDGFREDL